MDTTFHKSSDKMIRKPLVNCHEGVGPLDWTNVVDGEDLPGKRLRFLHRNILHPGDSIGIHGHSVDEEYYYILSGEGTMTLDGKELRVGPGDLTGVFPGGSHGLRNTGEEQLHFIVFSVQV